MSSRARVTGNRRGLLQIPRSSSSFRLVRSSTSAVPYKPNEGAIFRWADDPQPDGGMTVWSAFPADTKYFGTGPSPFMFNFRVADLDALLAQLKAEGVQVDPKREDYDYGRFAWIYDPEGNKIELWQPLPPK